MNNMIKIWRENARLSRAEMSRRMEIPVRTIENWDAGINTPPAYVTRLVINELKQITEREIVERARKRMAKLKSDENGERPVGSWAIIRRPIRTDDEYVDLYSSMQDAIDHIEFNNGYDVQEVGYVVCNDTEDGPQPWYCDKNGNVEADYDYINLPKDEVELYELKDWDGSIIFDEATLKQMAEYFGFEDIEDEYDLEQALKEEYQGMATPTFNRI